MLVNWILIWAAFRVAIGPVIKVCIHTAPRSATPNTASPPAHYSSAGWLGRRRPARGIFCDISAQAGPALWIWCNTIARSSTSPCGKMWPIMILTLTIIIQPRGDSADSRCQLWCNTGNVQGLCALNIKG